MTTATACCNNSQADTWEVQAKGADGQWWTVSDSSQMEEAEARNLAHLLRMGE